MLLASDEWAVESQGDGRGSPQSLPQESSSQASQVTQESEQRKAWRDLGVVMGVSLCGVSRRQCLDAWIKELVVKALRVVDGT